VPSQNDTGVLPSAILTASALLDVVLSGLDHTACSARCLRFAATVTHAQRKTRFRLVARPFAGRVRPAGFAQEGFGRDRYLISWRPPSQGFPWRSKI
jgi:hypothetical protein